MEFFYGLDIHEDIINGRLEQGLYRYWLFICRTICRPLDTADILDVDMIVSKNGSDL